MALSAPAARMSPGSSSVLDGRIYAVGGGAVYGRVGASVYAYDPASDAWTTLGDLPSPNGFLSVTALGSRLYAIGGQSSSLSYPMQSVWVYDPSSDVWTSAADMPTARHFHAGAKVDGRIYAMGGRLFHVSSEAGHGFATVEEFTPGN